MRLQQRLIGRSRRLLPPIGVALALLLVTPAWGQTSRTFTCGAYKTQSWRTANTSHWTIARAAEANTESAVLKKDPRFECIDGSVLAVEFVPANGLPFLDLYFPDGTNIGYGGQTYERNGRFVLPIQARPRIPAAYRAAFDYHCRLVMPADPIPPESRKDCVGP